MLPVGGRTALRLPPALLSPKEGIMPPAQPFMGVPAVLPVPLLPPIGSKKSSKRTQRRLCQGSPLAAGAANAHVGGPGKP